MTSRKMLRYKLEVIVSIDDQIAELMEAVSRWSRSWMYRFDVACKTSITDFFQSRF
jgi:hypothetical protein